MKPTKVEIGRDAGAEAVDMNQDLVILKLDRARQQLADAKTLQQTKQILDLAAAAEIYAKRQQLGEEAIGYAFAIKMEALARLGELLKSGQESGQVAGPGHRRKCSDREHLADLGVNRKTSMMAQQLAALPAVTRHAIAEKEVTLTEALRQQCRVERTATAAREADARVRATGERFGAEALRALAAAENRLRHAERACDDARKEAERTVSPFMKAAELARAELQAMRLALCTHTRVYESDESCPLLTEAEMWAAVHTKNGRVSYDFWSAAGHPDPGEFQSAFYNQYWRPGDSVCLPGPAWRLGPRPEAGFRRWVVSVSSPDQPQWVRAFWLRAISTLPSNSYK